MNPGMGTQPAAGHFTLPVTLWESHRRENSMVSTPLESEVAAGAGNGLSLYQCQGFVPALWLGSSKTEK